MNILVLISHNWRGGRASGMEVYTIELIRGLRAKGHSIFLATGKAGPESISNSAVTVDLELPFHSPNPLTNLQTYRRLRQVVIERHIDIVHAQHRTAAYFAHALWRKQRVPYVVTIHDPWHATPLKKLHGGLFLRMIAVSEFLRQLLIRQFDVPPEGVRTIRNGVDPSRFAAVSPDQAAALRAEFGIAHGEIVLSQVSRLSRPKGHRDLIEALALLPRTLNYRCLIFGEGPELPRLKQLVQSRGLENKVLFCGFRSDIPVVFAATDVMLLPSRSGEGLPLTVIEAMLSGVAVIAARTAGVPEIITDGQDGLLIDAGDIRSLAGHIDRLVTDANLRRRLAEAGRQTALERFLLSRVIDETEAYYREIVAHPTAEADATSATRKSSH